MGKPAQFSKLANCRTADACSSSRRMYCSMMSLTDSEAWLTRQYAHAMEVESKISEKVVHASRK